MKKWTIIATALIFVPCVCLAAKQETPPPKGQARPVSEQKVPLPADKKQPVVEKKAEQPAPALPAASQSKPSKPAPVKLETGTTAGVVHAIAPGNKEQNIAPLIIIELPSKEKKMFRIEDTTTIRSGKKEITLLELKKGAEVRINHVAKPVGITAVNVSIE